MVSDDPDRGLTIEQIGSAAVFAESVEPFLAAEPLLNTHPVGWLDATLRAEQRIAERANARMFGPSESDGAQVEGEHWPPILMLVRSGDDVVAAGIEGRRPGFAPIVVPGVTTEITAAAMFLIGSELATVGPQISMLTGPAALIEAINAGLMARGGAPFQVGMRMTLYELGVLAGPGATAGWSRPPDPSNEAEMELLARWQYEFGREVGLAGAPGPGTAQDATDSLRRSRFLFWCNDSGPVAMAAYGTGDEAEVLMGAARVYGVYSPPEHRGRRFGKAATHAVCVEARRRGARRILLFADVEAVGPNRIYQELGFEPVAAFGIMNRDL